jgi:hypothetical protein
VIVENVQPQSMEVFEHGRMLLLCFMEDLRACRAGACVVEEVQPKDMEVCGHCMPAHVVLFSAVALMLCWCLCRGSGAAQEHGGVPACRQPAL